eukprot:CAMPEP_0178448026 /NCGR_PEP_ID=MMETSP0689_2-20121128/41746_1 /TAXON_ID=160604 /ORGANISM="Amphidinium massartii, Strain CS-259" /LENGTH=49 /DNA_ID= /DNA_START= /DNA_END= /DNA_ORIENTATION=
MPMHSMAKLQRDGAASITGSEAATPPLPPSARANTSIAWLALRWIEVRS